MIYKLTGVWDFNKQSGKIGDFCVFLVNLGLVAQDNGIKYCEVVIVDDPNDPNYNTGQFYKPKEFKNQIISACELAPWIRDSVSIFDSKDDFERFIKDERPWTLIYPDPISDLAYGFNIYPHLSTRKEIRRLKSKPEDLEWAERFFKKFSSKPPIVLNARYNPYRRQERNVQKETWQNFLEFINAQTVFLPVFIGTEEEATFFDRKSLDNIIFSKDHETNLLQDAALMQRAEFSMMECGGIGEIGMLMDTKMILYSLNAYPHPSNILQHGHKFPFYKPEQLRLWYKPTLADLIRDFEVMVNIFYGNKSPKSVSKL